MPDHAPDKRSVDVLIVGAGLSGINMAYRIQEACPELTYAIVERRERIGGTWDLFRYPGVRSDSDFFTLAFPFRPWRGKDAIVDGDQILEYLEDTAREAGIDRHIALRPPRRRRRLVVGRRPAGRVRGRRRRTDPRNVDARGSSWRAPATTTTTSRTTPGSPASTTSRARSSTRSSGPRTSTTPGSASS